MDTAEILSKLISLMKKLCFKEGLDYSKITMESNLVTELGLDSIQIIMMAIGIEKEFDVIIQNIDFSIFKQVGDVVKYIEEKINEVI
jgi:acyl carrier protein